MPAPPPEAEIAALNREIEQLEGEVAVLEEQRTKRRKAAGRAAWRLRYYRAARKLRSLGGGSPQWRLGLMIIGPLAVGVVLFILADLVSDSFAFGLVCLLVGALATGTIVSSLLFRPDDNFLPPALAEAESKTIVATAHWKEAFQRLTEVNTSLKELLEERRAKMASGRVQRAALLQRKWKTMAASEWEDFVVEVCRTLGGKVDRRGHSENGTELVIDFGSRSVAAIVRTAREPLDSEAVRHAIAMRNREQCDHSAIITNGRFTGAAQDYAPRNGCRLIGREEFPDFVLGQMEW